MPMYSLGPPSLNPPYSAGTLRPSAPISARPWTISSGTSALWRCTCSACGLMTFSAKLRNVSATISMSSSRWRGPGVVASEATYSGVRNVSRNGWAFFKGAIGTPHRASRPAMRVIRSWIMSAAKPHASRASTSPFSP